LRNFSLSLYGWKFHRSPFCFFLTLLSPFFSERKKKLIHKPPPPTNAGEIANCSSVRKTHIYVIKEKIPLKIIIENQSDENPIMFLIANRFANRNYNEIIIANIGPYLTLC
jgi:hypothetical protein